MKGGRRGTGRRPITSCIVVSTMMLQALRCATDITALRELSSMREREMGGEGREGGGAGRSSILLSTFLSRPKLFRSPSFSHFVFKQVP